jgi:hypothetical protein
MWGRNCHTCARNRKKVPTMTGLATVRVSAGMRMIVKNFCAGVLGQCKARKDCDQEENPHL